MEICSSKDTKLQLGRMDKSRELRHNMMTIVKNIIEYWEFTKTVKLRSSDHQNIW